MSIHYVRRKSQHLEGGVVMRKTISSQGSMFSLESTYSMCYMGLCRLAVAEPGKVPSVARAVPQTQPQSHRFTCCCSLLPEGVTWPNHQWPLLLTIGSFGGETARPSGGGALTVPLTVTQKVGPNRSGAHVFRRWLWQTILVKCLQLLPKSKKVKAFRNAWVEHVSDISIVKSVAVAEFPINQGPHATKSVANLQRIRGAGAPGISSEDVYWKAGRQQTLGADHGAPPRSD